MRHAPFLLSAALLATQAAAQTPSPSPAAPSPSPAAEASPGPRFPAQVEMVTVDVVVTDKKGTPVKGLARDDFEVTEDNASQKIASFEAVTLPAAPSATTPERPRISTNTAKEARTGRSFVVLFDDVHLTPFQAQRAKQAVSQFLKTGVREGDHVTLVASGGGTWWSTRMEAGRDELIGLLKRLDGRLIPDTSPERMSDYEAMKVHVFHDTQTEQLVSRRFETYGAAARAGQQQSQDSALYSEGDPLVRARAADVYFQSVSRNRITLQLLDRVLQSLAAAKGRKSVILVSEGFIYDPNLDEFKSVVQSSRRANAAVYFLDTRGLSGMPMYMSAEFGPALPEQDIGAAFLDTMEEAAGAESISADSGGFTVRNTNDLGSGIQRIANETQSYYLIGYNPTNTARDGRFRKIQVRLSGRRKGLQLRARKGYYAPLEAGKTVAGLKPGTDPDIQAALDSPYDEQQIPLQMTSFVFDETLLGKAATLVATQVGVSRFQFEPQDGRFNDTLEFLLVVSHRETGEFFRYDQKIDMKLLPATHDRLVQVGVPIVRDFELAPGGYQAKIVVRDQNSGRIGTVVHEFEVPEFKGFRISTPIMSDTLQGEGDPKATLRPALIVRRTFPPGSTLYAQFEVYGAEREKESGMPNVTAGYVVRRKDGTAVVDVPPTRITPTSLGKLSRIIGSPLPKDAVGDFELVLRLKDEISGKTLEEREPFTVTTDPTEAASAR